MPAPRGLSHPCPCPCAGHVNVCPVADAMDVYTSSPISRAAEERIGKRVSALSRQRITRKLGGRRLGLCRAWMVAVTLQCIQVAMQCLP